MYAELSDAERGHLEAMVQVFVEEKHFEALGGLALNDEIRVVIAAQACLLILALDHDLYRQVESILVYPSTVYSPARRGSGLGELVEGDQAVLGQAHLRGPVILAWDAVRRGAYHPHDGRNVVFHEFAHTLDMLTGEANGAPPLSGRARRADWAEAFGAAFTDLQERTEGGERTLLGDYAASAPAEFFAVATERFFEQPRQLRREYPDVYGLLVDYFDQDPASRRSTRKG